MTEGRAQRSPSRQRRRWRPLAFHLAAIIVVLSPLVLAELLLRCWVAAPPLRADDPYVSFSSQSPLFVLDSAGTHFETAGERLIAFRAQSFAARKAPGTFRIFCLGGSTVQGRPYSVETSFPTWLKLSLQAARLETNWEVVNAGGISYASYRLMPIMQELLAHQPDLFVLYMGHNEFLEDRTYRNPKSTPPILIRWHRVLLGLRSYALADSRLARRRRQRAARTVLPPEVRTKLDLREGLESYHHNPIWQRNVIAHFARNLETMVRMARGAGVPIILMNPVSNLKDCPPFKSEFQTDLSDRDKQQVIALWEQAGKLEWTDAYEKIRLLEQAAGLESQHAGLAYLLGTCYEHVGRSVEAKHWFTRAKDEDICPLRILEPIHEAILEVVRRHGTPLVDAKAMIEERTEDGIPGDEWLLDHVHPSISGHQLIADAICQAMAEMDLIRMPDHWQTMRAPLWQDHLMPDHWQTMRAPLWQDHLASLNDAYYAQGAARLKRLQDWSRGRVHQK